MATKTTKTTQPKYTGTSVSKAGDVNYGISGDVLRAYGASQTPTPDATQYADAGVKQVSEYFKQKDQVKKEAENTWDESFDQIGNRQSWASPELYDQFKADVSAQREEYLAAIQRGDKAGADKILANLNSKSANVQTWKSIIETSTSVNDSGYFMPAGDMDPNDVHIMSIINKQTPGAFTYVNDPETGEGVFNIKMPDGSIKKVTQRDYESMVTKNMKPLEVEKSFTDSTNELASSIAKNKTITKITPDSKDYKTLMINNERLIKEENYSNLWKYDFTKSGGSPLDILVNHKDFKGINLESLGIDENDLQKVPRPTGKADAPVLVAKFEHDGILEPNEVSFLTPAQQDIILTELAKPENYEIGKMYLAELMTLTQVSGANQIIDENLAKADGNLSGYNTKKK